MFKKSKKGKIFEYLGKNVQNLKIFLKRASDCMQLLHAINCWKRFSIHRVRTVFVYVDTNQV